MKDRSTGEVFICACGEKCIALPHERTGKLAPITANQYPNGNIEILDFGIPTMRYRIASADERITNPKPRRLNHYANCPKYGRKPKGE